MIIPQYYFVDTIYHLYSVETVKKSAVLNFFRIWTR